MRGVMGEASSRPELSIADAIDTSFDLPVHRLCNGWCDLRSDDHGVRYLGAGKPPRHVLPALGRRQPADMRGSDPCHASLHVTVLPVPACDPAHDNTMDIAIQPVAAPTQRESVARGVRALGAIFESPQR